MKRLLLTLIGLWPFATASLTAQSDTAELAAALVRAQVPATDDPDQTAAALVRAALAHRRSPAAWFLVQEAIWLCAQVQDPRRLRELLVGLDPAVRQHGLLAQKCAELTWWLTRAVDGMPKAGLPPAFGYATRLVAVGPFGDSGDHFAGVVFAPELQFPTMTAELPGRGTLAKVRQVERRDDTQYLQLAPRGHSLPGCYYGLQRVAVDAAIDAYLELDHDGDCQVFVDQHEVLRVDRWLQTSPRRHYLGLHLPTGEHDVLIKTCSNDYSSLTLRWLDSDGNPLPGVRELAVETPVAATTAAATPLPIAFVTAGEVFTRAAERAPDDATLRLAALQYAGRDSDSDLTLQLAEPLRRTPPTEPWLALAFARALRFVPLPEELRKAEARRLAEAAIAALPADHHSARIAKVQLLDEQDQREQAHQLLAEHPAPGPETFARRLAIVRQLHFAAEETPLLLEWAARRPNDPQPLAALADAADAVADSRGALTYRQRALTLRLDQPSLLQAAFRNAVDTGELTLAAAWLELRQPAFDLPPTLGRLQNEWTLATARHDQAAASQLLRQMANHPDADAETLDRLAGLWARLGDREQSIACLEACLEHEGDHTATRAWLASLGEGSTEPAEFAAVRHDGAAACAAFQAGEREQGASTTVLVDQRLVEFRADGSSSSEVHELRRINDLAGVEAYRTAAGLAHVDEVLLVRTLATDGRDYVPTRQADDYALQRLEPGAFIEWRYREHEAPPAAGVLTAPPFYFGSGSEPCALSELVVILPKAGRGQLRTHRLGAPTKQQELSDGRTMLTFTRTDLAALPKEQLLPPSTELLPVAQVGEDETIFATLREQKVQLFSRTRPSQPILAKAQELFTEATDDRARLEAAWNYCQREIETGPGDGALSTLLRKKGSRFLLTVALLRAGGVPVAALACPETRPELGSGEQPLFADTDHLRVPGAMVTLGPDPAVYLCVDVPRYWPLGAVPAARAGSRAFVASPDDAWQVVTLPGSEDAVQTLRVRGEASLEGNEVKLHGIAEVGEVQGFALAERLRELKDNVQKLAARQIAQQVFPGWRVQKAALVRQTPGQPLRLEVDLVRAGAQANGDTFLVPMPMPPTRFVASFADRAERTLPYRLAADLISDWQIDFDGGPHYVCSRLPPAVSIHQPPLDYEQSYRRVGDRLRLERCYRITAQTLPADRFDAWLRTLAAADRADQSNLELVARPDR